MPPARKLRSGHKQAIEETMKGKSSGNKRGRNVRAQMPLTTVQPHQGPKTFAQVVANNEPLVVQASHTTTSGAVAIAGVVSLQQPGFDTQQSSGTLSWSGVPRAALSTGPTTDDEQQLGSRALHPGAADDKTEPNSLAPATRGHLGAAALSYVSGSPTSSSAAASVITQPPNSSATANQGGTGAAASSSKSRTIPSSTLAAFYGKKKRSFAPTVFAASNTNGPPSSTPAVRNVQQQSLPTPAGPGGHGAAASRYVSGSPTSSSAAASVSTQLPNSSATANQGGTGAAASSSNSRTIPSSTLAAFFGKKQRSFAPAGLAASNTNGLPSYIGGLPPSPSAAASLGTQQQNHSAPRNHSGSGATGSCYFAATATSTVSSQQPVSVAPGGYDAFSGYGPPLSAPTVRNVQQQSLPAPAGHGAAASSYIGGLPPSPSAAASLGTQQQNHSAPRNHSGSGATGSCHIEATAASTDSSQQPQPVSVAPGGYGAFSGYGPPLSTPSVLQQQSLPTPAGPGGHGAAASRYIGGLLPSSSAAAPLDTQQQNYSSPPNQSGSSGTGSCYFAATATSTVSSQQPQPVSVAPGGYGAVSGYGPPLSTPAVLQQQSLPTRAGPGGHGAAASRYIGGLPSSSSAAASLGNQQQNYVASSQPVGLRPTMSYPNVVVDHGVGYVAQAAHPEQMPQPASYWRPSPVDYSAQLPPPPAATWPDERATPSQPNRPETSSSYGNGPGTSLPPNGAVAAANGQNVRAASQSAPVAYPNRGRRGREQRGYRGRRGVFRRDRPRNTFPRYGRGYDFAGLLPMPVMPPVMPMAYPALGAYQPAMQPYPQMLFPQPQNVPWQYGYQNPRPY